MNEAINKDQLWEMWQELEIPELGDEFFKNAKPYPRTITKHTVLVDADVYEWLQQQPEGLRLVNQLLREYMETKSL
jgi:hypothetical protein